MAKSPQEREPLTALDMARNLARGIQAHGEFAAADPLGAVINNVGAQAQGSAELAANLAVVSVAESLDRIARALERMLSAEAFNRRL